MGKGKELCLPFMILLLHYNRWSSNISYKSISNKPNLLLVLEKNPVRSFVSESRRNNMNIYSLKNIIERYWDRIQNSQSRRWLINGCKWSSFLAIQYSNSTHLEPLIRDFVFKGLSFSQTILCYSKKNATPCKICFCWIFSSLPLGHCWACIHTWRGKKHICRMQSQPTLSDCLNSFCFQSPSVIQNCLSAGKYPG